MGTEQLGQGPVGQLGYYKDAGFHSECNEKDQKVWKWEVLVLTYTSE